MAVAVGAAHQHGAVAHRRQLPDMCGDVAHGVADAPVIGLVGRRAVDQADVMQGDLAGPEHDIDRLRLVDLDLDLLATAQEIALVERILVVDLLAMGARHDLHAAGLDGARREGDPGGDDLGLRQAPVGRVLMPAHEARIVRAFGEEATAPGEDVGADDVLDGVEHLGMTDESLEPGHQQVRLHVGAARNRAAFTGLQRAELALAVGGIGLRHDADREEEAVTVILRDLGRRKHLGRRRLPDRVGHHTVSGIAPSMKVEQSRMKPSSQQGGGKTAGCNFGQRGQGRTSRLHACTQCDV